MRTALAPFSQRSRRLAVALAAFVALVASVTGIALADPAQDCQQDKDLNLRVQGCTAFLNGSPAPAPALAGTAHLFRGWAYEQLGQYDAAITDFTASIADGGPPLAYTLRAYAYQSKQKFDLALADYNTALQNKPDYVEVYAYRGGCRLAAGDAAGAVADYGLYIQTKPDDAGSYFSRARAEVLLKQDDAAIADINHFMTLAAQAQGAGLFLRALVNEDKGLAAQAQSDFADAIAHNSRFAMKRRWVDYLRTIQADHDYANWTDKPYDLFLRNASFPDDEARPSGA
jgi:tetratricopeptide (TPR) repeat protein